MLLRLSCCFFVAMLTVDSAFSPTSSCQSVKCKYTYLDHSGRCAYCAKSVGDRCGGTLNYWGSCKPGLKCVYRLGSVFNDNEEKIGFCEKDSCSNYPCGFRQRCVERRNSNPRLLCKCNIYNCSGEAVCGNDGKGYSNLCHLYKHECHHDVFVGVKHKGLCDDKRIDLTSFRALNVPLSYKSDRCYLNHNVHPVGHINEDMCISWNCNNGVLLAIPIPGCGTF